MTSRRWRFALITLVLIARCVAIPMVLTWRQEQQERLNHALFAAVDRNDVVAAQRLLHTGADPNAQILPQDGRPVWQRWWAILQHGSGPTIAPQVSVLSNAIEWERPEKAGDASSIGSDKLATIRAIVDAGADVNRQYRKVVDYGSYGHYNYQTVPVVEAAKSAIGKPFGSYWIIAPTSTPATTRGIRCSCMLC